FFFQAEDGIRDFHVTGVQTCALPICEGAGPVLPAPPSEALPRRTLSARSAGTSPGGEGRVSPRRIVSRATLPAPRYAPCSALRSLLRASSAAWTGAGTNEDVSPPQWWISRTMDAARNVCSSLGIRKTVCTAGARRRLASAIRNS